MSVVSIKVPEEVKRDMEKRKQRINWSEEIRKFISSKIEEDRRRENIARADKILQSTRKLQKGTSSKLVREDRDSHN
ncbi:MAG TPA: hypothetical protein VJN71_11470 [Nitrososphaerales archaeon]|nr:hypothetical protein [Nitrososphaerales archaeon]